MAQHVFHPYLGIDEVRFGFSPTEVASIWGPPDATDVTRYGNREERRGLSFARYSSPENLFVSASFGFEDRLYCHNVRIEPTLIALDQLLALDSRPYLSNGFLVFFQLGIAATGIHDVSPSEFAVTGFAKGEFDRVLARGKPFDRQRDVEIPESDGES